MRPHKPQRSEQQEWTKRQTQLGLWQVESGKRLIYTVTEAQADSIIKAHNAAERQKYDNAKREFQRMGKKYFDSQQQLAAERDKRDRVVMDSQSWGDLKLEWRESDGRHYLYDKDGNFLWSGEPSYNIWRCVKLTEQLDAERQRREQAEQTSEKIRIEHDGQLKLRWQIEHELADSRLQLLSAQAAIETVSKWLRWHAHRDIPSDGSTPKLSDALYALNHVDLSLLAEVRKPLMDVLKVISETDYTYGKAQAIAKEAIKKYGKS